MSDDPDQTPLPASFVALHTPPHARRPTLGRAELVARHELCEDMAQLLAEPARAQQLGLGITEADVLERMQRVAGDAGTGLSPDEAGWVVRRLAELLDWRWPPDGDALADGG